ncbi:MAG: hypothetical protein RL885_11830 [Planctomycetota bacterium]
MTLGTCSRRGRILRIALPVLVAVSLCQVISVWIGGQRPELGVSSKEWDSAWRRVEEKAAKIAAGQLPTFDRPGEATTFFLRQRLAPGMTSLPREHLAATRRAILERESSPNVQAPGVRHADPTWRALGPGNIGGRTRALVIDPSDTSILYAAGVAGGVWKSIDRGQSWRPTGDELINLAVCSLVIDPSDPQVLYAGTGEGFSDHDVYVRGLGIFKTTDGGESWQQLRSTVEGVPDGAFHYVNDLVLSPNDPSRVYAVTRSGVWRSLDGGASWSVVLSNPWQLPTQPATRGCLVGCTDLAIRSDRNPDVLWACFGSFTRDGLYRSTNGGASWLMYTTEPNQGRMTVALAPTDNDVVYLLMADNGTGGPVGQLVNVYRSTDGFSFQPRVDFTTKTGPWLLSNLVYATGCAAGGTYAQGWHDQTIVTDPLDPDRVWVGGVDLFRSDDGGQSFGIASYGFLRDVDPPSPLYTHVDQHGLIFDPDFDGTSNQRLYLINDGGVFRTENARAATSQEDCPFPPDEPLPEILWENLNNGYAVTQFYHGDSIPGADLYLGGAQDNGTSLVRSVTNPNGWKRVFGGDGGYVAIDPDQPDTMYIEYQGFPTIQKSTDGGQTFSPAVQGITDTDGLFISPLAMDPSDSQTLWTGSQRPWRTMDGAGSWTAAGADLPAAAGISAIAVAPSDGNVVYLGYENGYVARSSNARSAQPSFALRIGGLVGGWVSSLAVDPKDPDLAYCTVSTYGVPHVFRTRNGGLVWKAIDGIAVDGVPDIPVHSLAVRPVLSRQLFVGTELGVFQSNDGGDSWQPLNPKLPLTVVEWLDFQDANTLVAFTHGRGAFRLRLDPALAK